VTCSGTTTNQNAANGYGDGTQTGIAVNVLSNASVNGTNTGISLGGGNTVNNAGTITGNSGIRLSSAGTVISSGSIAATGAGALGIFINGPGTATNSGSITSTGANALGIFINGPGTVTSSGPITSTGANALGIFVNGPGTVTNSGLVTANGTAARGIFISNSNSTLVNRGTIAASGAGSRAIGLNGNFNTLTNVAGSLVIGAITLTGTNQRVNFVGGNWMFTFNSLANTTIDAAGAPFAVSGNTVAVVDLTPFAMTDRTLMDFTRGVSSTLGHRFDGMAASGANQAMAFAGADHVSARFDDAFAGIPGMSAYAADTMAFKNPTMQYSNGSTVWGRGFAGQRTQQADGILLQARDLFYGGMIGGDWQAQPNLRLGAFLGAGKTRTNIDLNANNSDSDLVFGGVFGRYAWESSFLNVAVQAGHSQNSTKRLIANNLALTGLESATASYNGWYVSPEATLGRNFALGSFAGASYTLTPSVQLRYLYGSLDGYTEGGSTANLTVGSRTVGNFEERGQLKLTRTQVFTPTHVLMTNIYGGVLGNQRVGDTTIGAALLGQAIPFATPGKGNVWGGLGGLGLEVLAGGVAWFGSAEYLALSDSSNVVSGKGGIRIAF